MRVDWRLVVVAALSLFASSDGQLRTVSAVSAPATDAGPAPDPSRGLVYICPMDPDVRSHQAGVCRRCGMTLRADVPDPVAFHVAMRSMPSPPVPGEPAVLQFSIHDPWKERPVEQYNPVHERLFHAFIVSEDLEFFEHGHPALVPGGLFQYVTRFPKAGMFRVLGDFYPVGGTPQLATETVFVPGPPPPPARVGRDYSTKTSTNLKVAMMTIPGAPVAGNRTQVRFTLDGTHPLEKYLGAWGHVLAASSDLIDMLHEHPARADGGPQVEFDIVFPRPGAYRLWVQFQSDGVVNTARFDVPVVELGN